MQQRSKAGLHTLQQNRPTHESAGILHHEQRGLLPTENEDDIPGGEDDAWLCWSCARDTNTPFAHTDSPVRTHPYALRHAVQIMAPMQQGKAGLRLATSN